MCYLPPSVRAPRNLSARYTLWMMRKLQSPIPTGRAAYTHCMGSFRAGLNWGLFCSAMDNEEELNGVICIGAPIFNYTGYPCGAIWISGPKDRLSKEVVRVSADCIRKVAQTISLELGYSKAKKI